MARAITFDRRKYTTSEGTSITYLDSGGHKPLLHFLHANGFPTGVYLPLLEELACNFRVVGMSIPGQDGLDGTIESWEAIADHLTAFLESLDQGPIIGVGHSIGAVCTMIGAVKRPDIFSRVIMLDAVMMPRSFLLLFGVLQRLGKIDRISLVKRALNRRNKWADRQEAHDYFRDRTLFLGWKEPFFQAYLDHGLKPGIDSGLTLVCPPTVEAKVFSSYPLDVWTWPRRIQHPLLIVRGNESRELAKKRLALFLKKCPTAKGAEISGAGHLFPMQKPEETIRLIREFCQ